MELIDRVPFICECADANCMEIIRLSLDEYEAVRQHPARFFTAPGHSALSIAANAEASPRSSTITRSSTRSDLAGEIAVERYDESL